MSAAIHWIYGPDKPAQRMDYQWFFWATNWAMTCRDLSPDQNIKVQVYPLEFNGSTSPGVGCAVFTISMRSGA